MSDEMDEIWALYADDGMQALDAMEIALDALGTRDVQASDPDVGAFFRAVHTFKGNSRVLGLAVVESRAHLSEDLIGLVRDQGVPWDAEIRDILLMATDTLRSMLDETATTRADVAPDASEPLMERLRDKIARCTGAATESVAVTDGALPDTAAPDAELPEAPAPEPVQASAEPPVTPPPRKGKAKKAEAAEDVPVAVQAAPELPEDKADEPAADLPPVSDAASAPAPIGGIPRPPRLADDPTYRAIFAGMAADCLSKLRAALAGFATDPAAAAQSARREADTLAHAAGQMGLADWEAPLVAFVVLPEAAQDSGPEAIAQLVLKLEDLTESTFTNAGEAGTIGSADEDGFFNAIRDALAKIARFGTDFACGDAPDAASLAEAVDEVKAAARPHGFIRVSEAAASIPEAANTTAYRNAELRLYEELAAVEAVMPDSARASGISPRDLVQVWCAEHVFDTLAALETTIDRLRHTDSGDRDDLYTKFDRLMRLVRHACLHFGIETASQLALTLVDLFSRSHAAGRMPDAILTHIARGFIDTIELVFDALHQGETPDTANLDRLFEEAANVAFVKEGLVTASAIERRLGLPKEFHRVLSPESVRAASECLEQGQLFYVLRADINDDEAIAEAFIEWLSSGVARSITNVTVFRGNVTLFDFLIASPMDEARFSEAMAQLDPSLKKLVVQRALRPVTDEADEAATTVESDFDVQGQQSQQGGVTAEMLESIGEIAASQSMISHILSELAESDLAEAIDTALRGSNNDVQRARAQVRTVVGHFTARLQEVAQLEAQLVGKLAQLQEETVDIRSRRIETVLRPLETFVQTYSRRNRQETRFSSTGGELSLDITILEGLRRMLRSLVKLRLDQGEHSPTGIHIAFQRDEERVLVVFEDDGGPILSSPVLDDIQAGLTKLGGSLRAVVLPGKGMRHHISVPLAMVVLEGMVVGVEGVRYVMPVDAIRMILQPERDLRFRISAAEGREMLRIAEDELVAVTRLGRADPDAPGRGRGVYVVLGAHGRSVAVPVDELVGQQLVLLRPLRGVLSGIGNMTGIALLAGGEVGMVVSPNMLCTIGAEEGPGTSFRM